MNLSEPLLYRRGFVVCEKGAAPFSFEQLPPHWESGDLGTHDLFFDPLVTFHELIAKDLFLLGSAWDVRGEPVLETLKKGYNESLSTFLDELDYVAGRFILFYRVDGQLQVTQDALGLRSVFYSERSRCLSSHYHLLRELNQEKIPNETVQSVLQRKITNNMLPGHYTPDRHILMLTPNQTMSLDTFEWVRIFPREDYEERTIDSATLTVERAIHNLLKQIESRLLVPLTAGLDSRTTLALLRGARHHQYFTYGLDHVKSHRLDLEVAEELARRYRLPHVNLPLDGNFGTNDEERRFVSHLRRSTIRRHSFEVAWKYYRHFSSDYLHIRSNGYEVGRKYYREAFSLTENISVTEIARTFSKLAPADPDVMTLTEQFIKKANLSDSWNYDAYDLYYWEHRMGTWHASLLLESDLAHDSFVLINARHILKSFLSVPYDAQVEGAVQRNLIKRFDETLLGIKINGL